MAHLFQINQKTVFPNPETLLIFPFKEIWSRDTSTKKTKALEELAYIEFITSMRKSNPYRQYPEHKKHEVITNDIITHISPNKWKPDELINQAIIKVTQFQKEASTTYSYYMAAKHAAEKMQNFFTHVDVNERNDKGTPVYKPADITRAINDTDKTLANLKALEKKVEEELFEETKNRSDKQISPFADPNSLTAINNS